MSGEKLREAAALMREQHGPDHVRHEMWAAMAAWLDVTAERIEARGWMPTSSNAAALAVANAYLEASA